MCNPTSNIITCKAAVLWGVGEAVKVEEIQVDPPKASEVRIKMLCASLCHTDILCCNGLPVPLFPRIPGHEGVGMVESVGEGVTEVKEGDIVMPTYVGECDKCDNCRSGKTNLCHTYPLPFNGLMPDGTSRMSIKVEGGKRENIYHHFTCSTWSEYIVIDVNYVVKIDPRIPLPHVSFMSCGYSTGFGSTWKEAYVHKGSTVAVLGLGAVGLGVIEGARTQGAARIIGVDINEKKREKGKVFGMTDFINPRDTNKPISELVMELTGGLGADYCFECTGIPAFVNEAMESTKVGIGTAVLIGAGKETSGAINFIPLLCGRTLKGTIYGGIKTKSDLPILFDKCLNKELHLDELLTHQVCLDEINKAFQLMKQPDCIKVVIKF
ncbi:Alcohol dehydrogenase-like [Actinidia chinensis var. chinensis]|uniref:Alcohol dehydrogenase-like n=1 Tax=Actinidia chinensis var. chinensis TaxID=1590841 RepID=A0A2R6Q9K7_ACTCC|nr:Alcohol dehydrogenase-like [Actinidia chinensis var. chinensis]